MRKTYLLKITTSLFLIGLTALTGCKKTDSERQKEVIVYTYDSFVSEWGPGSEIQKLFEEETGLKLTFVDCGDGIQILSRAILEKDKVQADVILGLDNNISGKARAENLLEPYKPAHAEEFIPADVIKELGDDWILTPYDYSHFAMIYDTQSNVPAPSCLQDLTKPEYKGKIILMDPRTSTPGLGFVAWTAGIFQDKVLDYWKALKPNILTMAPGWSSGYGLFKKGEAPLVISYTTSPASHVEYDKTDRYTAPVFQEGHSMQVEGAGILKGAPNKKGAMIFIDFLISEKAQSILPLTQWMNPANKTVELPDSYKKAAPIPEKTVHADPETVARVTEEVMKILGK